MAKKKQSKRRDVSYKDYLTEEGLSKIKAWAEDGMINKQIADLIGVSTSTLYNWQVKYPPIKKALTEGKEVPDIQVEDSLFKKALGFEYTETKITESNGRRKVETTTKFALPDTTAMIFWLKNRMPAKWRDAQYLEHKGNMEVNNPLADMSTEDLKKVVDNARGKSK